MEVSGSRNYQTKPLVTNSRSRLPERAIPSPARRRSPGRHSVTHDIRQHATVNELPRGRSIEREARFDDFSTDKTISLMGFSANGLNRATGTDNGKGNPNLRLNYSQHTHRSKGSNHNPMHEHPNR